MKTNNILCSMSHSAQRFRPGNHKRKEEIYWICLWFARSSLKGGHKAASPQAQERWDKSNLRSIYLKPLKLKCNSLSPRRSCHRFRPSRVSSTPTRILWTTISCKELSRLTSKEGKDTKEKNNTWCNCLSRKDLGFSCIMSCLQSARTFGLSDLFILLLFHDLWAISLRIVLGLLKWFGVELESIILIVRIESMIDVNFREQIIDEKR